jgi:hypothetical protein
MKKFILLLFLFLTGKVFASSSNVIMLCNSTGNVCTPYSNLADAYNDANNGDIIYLPAGSFTMPNPINKSISIIGVGANIDSCLVYGGRTQISNDIVVDENDVYLEGLFSNSNIVAGSTGNKNISGLTIKHCKFSYLSYSANYPYSKISNATIINCYADVLDFGVIAVGSNISGEFIVGHNNFVTNCIIGVIVNTNASTIASCNFRTGVWYGAFQYVYNSTVKDCIISTVVHNGDFVNNIVRNNILQIMNADGSNQIFSNLILNADLILPFGLNNMPFPVANSLNINNGNIALISSSMNGEIGLHGGMFPWRNYNSVPSNPHIYYKNISDQTNNTMLDATIKVRSGN